MQKFSYAFTSDVKLLSLGLFGDVINLGFLWRHVGTKILIFRVRSYDFRISREIFRKKRVVWKNKHVGFTGSVYSYLRHRTINIHIWATRKLIRSGIWTWHDAYLSRKSIDLVSHCGRLHNWLLFVQKYSRLRNWNFQRAIFFRNCKISYQTYWRIFSGANKLRFRKNKENCPFWRHLLNQMLHQV